MRTRGILSGPSDLLDVLRLSENNGRGLDPRRHSYRMFVDVTTADERYIGTVNASLWVGTGIWWRDELVIE